MLIKVPTGKETHAHSGPGSKETVPKSPASSRFPHSRQGGGGGPHDSPRGALRARTGEGGGTRGREASPGCAPRGPEPQISHRSARLGAHGCAGETGGQAAAQLSPAPGASAPLPRPHPRARLLRLSGTLAAEIHLSVQGQDRNCKLSLANRKFLIDKVLPP